MYQDLSDTTLVRWLRSKNQTILAGKVLELPAGIGQWLQYVPATFPQFTRHTADHSLQIVNQLGNLLFHDDNPETPAVALSPAEAYLLILSAYFHDAGMVCSDAERELIVTSDAWKEWTEGDGPAATRWQDISDFRATANIDSAQRDLIADRESRILISEFVRRRHHLRSADLVLSEADFVKIATLGEPTVAIAVANICAGHGLSASELSDTTRYPERTDILGDKVNVRFVGHLLRIADLLDMGTDRACPFLMTAAAPLPPDSIGHWTQYQRITHRLTAPDRIEISAACNTQEEHRLLQDWCQWIADEATAATRSMAHSARHGGWQSPAASVDGPSPTMVVAPSPDATYIPDDWKFTLDPATVFDRLITDAYHTDHAWLRELVQNSCDTTRCRLMARSADAVQSWTLERGDLDEFPIEIAFTLEEHANPIT